MENSAPTAATLGCRQEPSIDPVKSQGILESINSKSKIAAQLWREKWGFYSQIQRIQEEEALKIGISLEQYKEAIRSRSCRPDSFDWPVEVIPSPTNLPATSAGMIGRLARCPLERYGHLVMTGRDYPIRPPVKPDQTYNPYKQTLIFLGSVDGDPISYKLPPSRCEVTDEMWSRPRQLCVSPLNWAKLELLLQDNNNTKE